MKEWAKSFYKSKAWIECRNGYMQSQNFICEICQGPALICHHKEWLTPASINDPSVTLNWDNLQAVCLDCHNKIHIPSSPTAEGLIFDRDGNLKAIPGVDNKE